MEEPEIKCNSRRELRFVSPRVARQGSCHRWARGASVSSINIYCFTSVATVPIASFDNRFYLAIIRSAVKWSIGVSTYAGEERGLVNKSTKFLGGCCAGAGDSEMAVH